MRGALNFQVSSSYFTSGIERIKMLKIESFGVKWKRLPTISLKKKKKDKIKWKKDGRIKRDKCSTTDSQEEASIFYRDHIFHGRIVMAPKSLLVSFACNAQCNIQSIKKVGDLNFKVCIFTSYGRYRISRETLAKNPLLCFVSFY